MVWDMGDLEMEDIWCDKCGYHLNENDQHRLFGLGEFAIGANGATVAEALCRAKVPCPKCGKPNVGAHCPRCGWTRGVY